MPPILPTINASLNALSGILLFCGYRAIKAGDRKVHRAFMISAFVSSTVFLCTYVTYHVLVPGVTRYQGHGIWRPIYYTILLTHTPLAAIIVPFAIAALWHATKQNFKAHTKITKWLFPVWSYVSVTGVIIYLMLYCI